jgi:hypothetical protein
MIQRLLSFFSLAAVLGLAQTAPPVQKGLTVTILQGDGVVHVLPNPPASHISIRVADGEGKPVKDAVAIFELPELGASATLPDGSAVKVILTDHDGAAAIDLQSNGVPGHFEPKITVNYMGQTATSTLKQENAFNPDVRPGVYRRSLLPDGSTRAKKSHGISKKTLWAILGGAVAVVGAIFAMHHKSASSSGGGLTITPGSGTVGGH